MTEFIELMITAVGAFLASCMLTTLYGKQNPLYSLAEEIYIGVSTGLVVILSSQYIYRVGILGILEGDWILIIGIILGLLSISRILPQYSHFSRLPIGIAVGAQLGLTIRTQIFTGFIQHVSASVMNLFPADTTQLIYNWTILLSLVPMLTFFLYTVELKGPLKWTSKIGEISLYLGLGSIFASTYMGRLGMFVGFMQSFTLPSWKIPYLIVSMVIVLVAVIILDRTGLIDKWIPE
jgi:small basic protein